MAPQTPAAPPTNTTPPAPPRKPPEEQFWQHYSPHHEFPLSSITSVALHVLGVVLLLVVGWVLIKLGLGDENKPPDVRAVFVEDPGGGGSKTGVAGSKGSGGPPLPAEDIGPPTEAPLPEVITDDDVRILAGTGGILGIEDAADGRIYAEHRKIVFAYQTAESQFLLSARDPHLPIR